MKALSGLLLRIEECVIALLLVAVTVILFMNVGARYLFSASFGWAEEFARYAIVWVTFVGSSVCISKNLHIAIDLLSSLGGSRCRLWLARISTLAGLGLCVCLAYYSYNIVEKVARYGQTTSALDIPMSVVYAAMPVGFALMSLRLLERLIATGAEPDPAREARD